MTVVRWKRWLLGFVVALSWLGSRPAVAVAAATRPVSERARGIVVRVAKRWTERHGGGTVALAEPPEPTRKGNLRVEVQLTSRPDLLTQVYVNPRTRRVATARSSSIQSLVDLERELAGGRSVSAATLATLLDSYRTSSVNPRPIIDALRGLTPRQLRPWHAHMLRVVTDAAAQKDSASDPVAAQEWRQVAEELAARSP
jgi:hypothetical protein